MAEKREFLIGMLMGSAIGAAVALLYAPQAGEGTRELLKERAGEAKGKALEVAGGVRTTVAESTDVARARVADAAGSVKARVSEATGTVREKVSHVADSVKSSSHDLVERGRQAVEVKKAQITAAVEAGKEAYEQKRSTLEADVAQTATTPTAESAPPSDEKPQPESPPSA
jgi:gas vesicle protein